MTNIQHSSTQHERISLEYCHRRNHKGDKRIKNISEIWLKISPELTDKFWNTRIRKYS
jgi:hypothetical protein